MASSLQVDCCWGAEYWHKKVRLVTSSVSWTFKKKLNLNFFKYLFDFMWSVVSYSLLTMQTRKSQFQMFMLSRVLFSYILEFLCFFILSHGEFSFVKIFMCLLTKGNMQVWMTKSLSWKISKDWKLDCNGNSYWIVDSKYHLQLQYIKKFKHVTWLFAQYIA